MILMYRNGSDLQTLEEISYEFLTAVGRAPGVNRLRRLRLLPNGELRIGRLGLSALW